MSSGRGGGQFFFPSLNPDGHCATCLFILCVLLTSSGQACAARYVDGQVYRVDVIEMADGDTVRVRYSDFGGQAIEIPWQK